MTEVETGRVYRMTKKNDVFSGLGALDKDLDDAADGGDATSSNSTSNADSNSSSSGSGGGTKEKLASIDENENDDAELIETDKKGSATQDHTTTNDNSSNSSDKDATATSTTTTASNIDSNAVMRARRRLDMRHREAELAREIARAECIVETLSNSKVYRNIYMYMCIYGVITCI
jgi:hypothetical protein